MIQSYKLKARAIRNKIIPCVALMICFTLCVRCNGQIIKSNRKMTNDSHINPPIAAVIPRILETHGDKRVDNYYWLNDRTDPKVIDYLNAENAYMQASLEKGSALRESLYKEITGRIPQTDISVPYIKNSFYYYSRYETGGEYPIYARKADTSDAPEQIMVDANLEAKGHSYYKVNSLIVSPDNQWVAYGEDTVSRRIYNLKFRNIAGGESVNEIIPNTEGYCVWYDDNKTILYVEKDPVTLRSFRVKKHVLGTDPASDKLIFEENDEAYYVYVSRSLSGKYIYINCWSTLTSETHFTKADNPQAAFKLFAARRTGHLYEVTDNQREFYIKSNYQARNFRIMKTAEAHTDLDSWKELIPHRKDVLIEHFTPYAHFFTIEERTRGIVHLKIIYPEMEQTLSFDEEANVATFTDNYEFNPTILRFSYTSLVTPPSIFDLDLSSGERTLMKQQEVVGGYDPSQYVSERLEINARDGSCIPISLVYKKSLKTNGNNPLLLNGYGSYGYSLDPMFSSVRLSLLDRGFVFAIAHIRGGEEMGREWYEDGKLLNKKNTFTDFIDCAKALVEYKFTTREHLYAMGGSAGGLLMGAVMNMEPKLFNGIIAAVPFVDVLTTMLDTSIPLTTGEFNEWGDPSKIEYYKYMKSYSPYDNVVKTKYPALLVTTGLYDSQVQYWEPAKWVAKLRLNSTSKNPIYLHTDMEAGHGGASGRFERYRETALMYGFLCQLEGIKK